MMKKKELIFAIMAVMMLTISGCKNNSALTENNTDSSADSTENETSEESNAVEEEKGEVVWVLEPSIDFDYVSEIFIGDSKAANSNYFVNRSGYSTEIAESSQYRNDVIAVCKDGNYGVYDFDGNELISPQFKESPLVQGPYDYNPFTWNGSVLCVYADDFIGTVSPDYSVVEPLDYVEGGGGDNPNLSNGYTYTPLTYKEGTLHSKDMQGNETDVKIDLGAGEVALLSSDDSDCRFVAVDGAGNVVYKSDNWLFGNFKTRIMNGYYPVVSGSGFLWETNISNYSFYPSVPGPNDQYRIAYAKESTGELITDYIYEATRFFNDGYAPVEKEGKWGYINESGEEVTDFVFDDASALFNGKAYVAVNGYYGILDLVETLNSGAKITAETMGTDSRAVNESFRDALPDGTEGYLTVNSEATEYLEPSDSAVIDKKGSDGKSNSLETVYEILENNEGKWYRTGPENYIRWFKDGDKIIFSKGY